MDDAYETDGFSPAPFSHERKAIAIRDAVDYSMKISYEDAMAGRNKRPIRVYGDGVYDMFHSGHARQLMQAKTTFPGPVYLLVGIPNDVETIAGKGTVVMTELERAEMVRHCRYVDEVILRTPFLIDDAFLLKHKIDFVAHDDEPYKAGDIDDIYKWLKERGMFLPTRRSDGVSTSDLIARVVYLNPQPHPVESYSRQLINGAERTWQFLVEQIYKTLFKVT